MTNNGSLLLSERKVRCDKISSGERRPGVNSTGDVNPSAGTVNFKHGIMITLKCFYMVYTVDIEIKLL